LIQFIGFLVIILFIIAIGIVIKTVIKARLDKD